MRILFCDNSLKEFVNFRGKVVEHYLAMGADVVVAAPRNADPAILPAGARYFPLEVSRSGMNPVADLQLLHALWRLMRRERPDHVFTYTIKPNVYGSIAAKWLGVESTAMVPGLGYAFGHDDLKSRAARGLYKLGLSLAKNVFVLNRSNMETLVRGRYVPRAKVIWLTGGEGVDLTRFS